MTPEQQRMKALARANDTRTQRADLKHDLKVGKVHIRDLLLRTPPRWLRTMRVEALLRAAPGIGRWKAARAVQALGASPSVPLHALSPKDRSRLVSWLRENCPTVMDVERKRARPHLTATGARLP